MRIGSLASHLRVLGDEFEEFLAIGKIIKVRSCYNNMNLNVQTHTYDEITSIVFDEACALLQWAHLPRDQIVGKRPVILGFVGQLVAGWISQVYRRSVWMIYIDLVSDL